MIQQVVCKESDIQEGDLKEFTVGPGKILVTKFQGKLSAVSSKCTHYGAPLIGGAYKDGKVRCPWHGACFNTTTGDIEDYPGLDSLHKFDISVENGEVTVTASEEILKDIRRVKTVDTSIENNNVILIVGGGGAAMVCAETLRHEGYQGKIIIATMESHIPYDRPKLSKMMSTEAWKLYLRKPEFLKEYNITLMKNKMATSVDTKNKIVLFGDNTSQKFDTLFIATGGTPRTLTFPGSDLSNNILYLRSPENANEIHERCQGKDVVIVGSGFIGMEVASYLSSKAKSVTVLGSGKSKLPFERLLGEKIGQMYIKLHQEKGVKFYLGQGVKEFTGSNNTVNSVILQDGTVIPTDVVISGIGVKASTDFIKDSNIQMNNSGHIIVDKNMKTSVDNIYAGGDIVLFPYLYGDDELINIGHWQLAAAHGRCAAMNMIGKKTTLKTVPFFWTQQFGKSLRYAGHCSSYDEIIFEGDVDELKFAAYYAKSNKVSAIACMNMGAKASEVAFKIEAGEMPNAAELKKFLKSGGNDQKCVTM